VVDRDSANTRADAVCREFSQLPGIIEALAVKSRESKVKSRESKVESRQSTVDS
jgi:hypothetical protein